MAPILVVDDDRNLCTVLKELLKKGGFPALVAHDVDSAIPIIKERNLELVITDLMMPGKSGMDLLRLSKEFKPALPVIMITAFGNIEAAVNAIKNGAYDFITKPFDEDELVLVVEKALSESKKNRELISDYFEEPGRFLPGFIGESPSIEKVFRTVEKIAPTDSTVLITGETGVGKELVARAIHLASPRRKNPFVKVNCAAIPENLIESELFGYEKGAFTGAVTTKPGRFEIADGGTLFLDEIGDMPLHLQVKMLTVLQDREFERLGGVKTIKVDMRTVAATNIDLRGAVESGSFRADLFFRLNVVPIHITPLRERRDDIILQARYFLKKFATKYGKDEIIFSLEVIAAFGNYDWPGNTRELENAIERMVLMAEEGELTGPDLPEEIRGVTTQVKTGNLKEKMGDIFRITEKQMIIDALNTTNQNRTRAAKLLGISRRTLQNKIKEYGL